MKVLKTFVIVLVLALAWYCPAQAQWSALKNTPPIKASTALLLTDGTVMCQDLNAIDWWKLTPDSSGSYVNGTWTEIASMRNPRLYYASGVLASGLVFVAGGEFSGTTVPVELDAAELYDPVGDAWYDLPTPGWGHIGDAPCTILSDGSVILGDIESPQTAILDPNFFFWTPSGLKNDPSSSEETWTLLPDGTVLTIDCTDHPESEIYDPSVDFWFDIGPSTGAWGGDPVEAASIEIGPAILQPMGDVIAFGASGHNNYYFPATGTWRRAPDFPVDPNNGLHYGIKDGPASLLPFGGVLCAAGPVDGIQNDYLGPTVFFEFMNGKFTQVAAPPTAFPNLAPFNWRMLLLPTGEVMATNGTGEVFLYSHIGLPDDRWRPTVSQWPTVASAGTTNTITGTQFNGLSQAVCYGDDAAAATNYPLVRLTNINTHHVRYARTANHSTMAVATGNMSVSTQFTIPSDIDRGETKLEVVANGLASKPVRINIQ
ncbi:MAG TPA: hypothetical protein VKU00_25345 [Chthonomonadaceae bacterium]|nr:hypothetical protein [Chthonomonadaceae bacterium]